MSSSSSRHPGSNLPPILHLHFRSPPPAASDESSAIIAVPAAGDVSRYLVCHGCSTRRPAHPDRLCRDGDLLHRRPRGGLGPATSAANQHRFLPLWSFAFSLEYRAGVHLSQPRCAGSHRHGRVGRQVRYRDQPLLLGRRHSGDGLRGPVHDAVLLRLAGPFRPGVFATAFRREDPDVERRLLRGDDGLLLGRVDVCDGEAHESAAGLELRPEHRCLRVHRPRLCAARRAHQCHLQRGASVFPDCFRLCPVGRLGFAAVGGWQGLSTRLSELATTRGLPPDAYTQAWTNLGEAARNPIGVEWFGLVMGLGFVLSFGYWCTDFLVVQRAMAADSMSAARRTPLIAAVPKLLFPFLVILPGMIALSFGAGGRGLVPAKPGPADARLMDARGAVILDYDLATPMMLVSLFPSGMLGLGLTALLASFMSGMAGNVTAFNTVWTYDIYQSHIRRNASDAHYLWMGRAATVGGIVLSVAAAYVASTFNNIMDLLQLVFAFVNAPLFATFALGMFWRRASGHGAFAGLVAGTAGAAIHHGLSLPAG